MMPPRVKYPYIGKMDWSGPRIMDIPDTEHPEQVYLRRFIVFKTPFGAIYVHAIFVNDGDRDPHNHPMAFVSWVVRGGYVEKRWRESRLLGFRVRPWMTLARTTRKDFHSIRELIKAPTITVMFCGPRRQDWGFMTPEGFVDQTTYRARLDQLRPEDDWVPT